MEEPSSGEPRTPLLALPVGCCCWSCPLDSLHTGDAWGHLLGGGLRLGWGVNARRGGEGKAPLPLRPRTCELAWLALSPQGTIARTLAGACRCTRCGWCSARLCRASGGVSRKPRLSLRSFHRPWARALVVQDFSIEGTWLACAFLPLLLRWWLSRLVAHQAWCVPPGVPRRPPGQVCRGVVPRTKRRPQGPP